MQRPRVASCSCVSAPACSRQPKGAGTGQDKRNRLISVVVATLIMVWALSLQQPITIARFAFQSPPTATPVPPTDTPSPSPTQAPVLPTDTPTVPPAEPTQPTVLEPTPSPPPAESTPMQSEPAALPPGEEGAPPQQPSKETSPQGSGPEPVEPLFPVPLPPVTVTSRDDFTLLLEGLATALGYVWLGCGILTLIAIPAALVWLNQRGRGSRS